MRVLLVGTTSSPQSATLTAVYSTCFQFASIQISGDFIQMNNCPTLGLPADTSCTFSISFAATAGGTRYGSLTGTSITGAAVNIALTGTGYKPTPVAAFSPTPSSPRATATILLHRAPNCSSRHGKCHKFAANSKSTLELKTEEWVSG